MPYYCTDNSDSFRDIDIFQSTVVHNPIHPSHFPGNSLAKRISALYCNIFGEWDQYFLIKCNKNEQDYSFFCQLTNN